MNTLKILILLGAPLVAPNPNFTPGVIRSLTVQQICTIKWGADARHVTEAMKSQVAMDYGIPRNTIVASGKGPCCEFDHLIPRELGGADDIKNLWPEPWADAHIKDHEENRLHVALCAGTITLEEAQKQMQSWGR